MSTQHTREELVYLAKLAEQCERYDGKSKVSTILPGNPNR